MNINSKEQAQNLLGITSSKKLESWLKDLAGPNVFSDENYWQNVGSQRSNAGPIEASADEINPLVERIVNSIEAVIELRVANSGTLPVDPRDAIEKLFQVPGGDCSRLEWQKAQELAKHVSVTLRGKSRDTIPTIEVRDKGIGIHPSNFANSILALGQSDKGQKPYLIGMYGQGGSSTFDKCEYTVIVSRRHPKHLSNELNDETGWTVVKRSLDVRAPVYKYLIDPITGSVPKLSRQASQKLGLDHGTIITHIEYRNTGGFASQKITNNAYYTLNYRLFSPLLTWTLADRRGEANDTRTMRGIPYRIDRLPTIEGIGSSEKRRKSDSTFVRDHMHYLHKLASGAHLKVEWWVLQDENVKSGRRRQRHDESVKPYKDYTRRYSRRAIAITRGGQTHASLTSNIFKKKRLHQVSKSIVVQVNTDEMTFEESASFFASNRADLKTASQDLVERAVSTAIDLNFDQLRAIERERVQEIVDGRSASDEDRIRRHLDPMIDAYQKRNSGQGSATDRDRLRDKRFRGKKVPTYLRFARRAPLEVRPGIPTSVDLLTDAANETVKRNKRTLLRIEGSHKGLQIGQPRGENGRYRVPLYPSVDLPIGIQIEVTASISQPGAWLVEADQSCRVAVIAPPPPYIGIDPPTLLRFRSQNGSIHVRQGGSRVTVLTDAQNELIKNGASFHVVSPDPENLPILGLSGPKDGEFRVGLRVPENAPLGLAGKIHASLTLETGSELEDLADLVIDPMLKRGGQTATRFQPNYDIKDVSEIRHSEDQTTWDDMSGILEIDDSWNDEDVGAFLETDDETQRKVTFYLNADNKHIKEVVTEITRRQPGSAAERFKEIHRSLICFHLYKLATRTGSEVDVEYTYRDYKQEMVRVSETLLFTHKEFIAVLDLDEPEQ